MTNSQKPEQHELLFIKQPSNSDLRGRQSVRATFKLTPKAINAISIVSVHLGIKQKSLFDLLFEDTQILNSVANGLIGHHKSGSQRIQKTYVLSRKTLQTLENISKNSSAPRDALVEYSINRLESIITVEKEKHRIRKELAEEFSEHFGRGKRILKKAAALLGEDDPVYQDIANSISSTANSLQNMGNYIKRGSIIEDY